MPLSAGIRIGPYEIVAPLGAGGMGVVYLARDSRLRREVALKVLPEIAVPDSDAEKRLLREARTAASLNHPHICTVYDVGDAESTPFIAMELVEGETLRQAIAQRKFSPERICAIGIDLARALEYAHARGVVHRDFKPANIMLKPNGHVKIMDFGIAIHRATPADETRTNSADHVLPDIAGTLGYMAPEVLQGSKADVRSDIWSLGVVLYELMSGRSPFDRKTDSDVIASILRDPPAPLPSGTPAGMARVIERCLSKSPEDRPATAGEIALALEIANPAASAEDPTPQRSMSKRAAWIAAPIALAVTIAALSYLRSNEKVDMPPLVFSSPVQLTTAIGVEEFAAWSPDGHTLAYSADISGEPSSPTWDIFVMQPGGGAPINRTSDFSGRDLFPSWSPDGSQIAFWSERDGGGCYVMPALGGAARRVMAASLADPNPPVWSSNGGRLGCVAGEVNAVTLDFVAIETGQPAGKIVLPGEQRRSFVTITRDGRLLAVVDSTASISSDVKRLWVRDTTSGKSTALTDGRTNVVSPSWSPDGRSLYYVASSGGAMDLWAQRVTPDGSPDGPPRAVTTGVGMRNAALSPDATRLAYSQGRKVANVWRVPLRTDRPANWADAMQVTFDRAFIECFDLNRAGTSLVVSSDRLGSLDLWTLPASGGEMQQLTADPSAEWCPNWSPDGLTVAFYAYRTGNREVWTIPAAGGEWRRITDNPGVDMHPSWSADGKELMLLTSRGGWAGYYAQPLDGTPGRRLKEGTELRWSPVDHRVAFIDQDGDVMVAADDGRGQALRVARVAAEGRPQFAVNSRVNWTPDGSTVVFLGASSLTIVAADADGKHSARTIADLSGHRGIIGGYGTPTDGKYVYFTWNEDVGDLWMMNAARTK